MSRNKVVAPSEGAFAFVSTSSVGNSSNVTTYSAKGQICNENIFTTRDRAALVFHEYVRHREWTTDWLAYLGVFIGLLVSLITSEFSGFEWKGKVVVSSELCKDVVILICAVAGFLSLFCLCRRVYLRKKLTCAYFIEQLKKDYVNVD